MHQVPEGVLRFIPLVSTSQYNWSSGLKRPRKLVRARRLLEAPGDEVDASWQVSADQKA